MELERDLDLEVGRLAVCLPPELLGNTPLIVENIQRARVPGVHDPVGPPPARLTGRQARHRDDPVLAQPVGQPDAAPHVLGVFRPDHGVGMERVAVAVQARDADAGTLEDPEEVVPGRVGGEDVVEGGNVHGGKEAAGVQFDARETEPGGDLDRLGQAAVVQDRVVDPEFHQATASADEANSR